MQDQDDLSMVRETLVKQMAEFHRAVDDRRAHIEANRQDCRVVTINTICWQWLLLSSLQSLLLAPAYAAARHCSRYLSRLRSLPLVLAVAAVRACTRCRSRLQSVPLAPAAAALKLCCVILASC